LFYIFCTFIYYLTFIGLSVYLFLYDVVTHKKKIFLVQNDDIDNICKIALPVIDQGWGNSSISLQLDAPHIGFLRPSVDWAQGHGD
jgi:hypothetical protein